jgi:Domain of unknown function (DUF4333)
VHNGPVGRLATFMVLALLALAGCGDEGDKKEESSGGGSDRAAVEKAARAYIVEQQSDEDDTERSDALSVERANVNGDGAEVKAKSSLTGNVYEVTLRKQAGTWKGSTLFTDRPSEPTGGGGNPAEGSGKEVSTDQVEQQIDARLLKPLRIKGSVECPPTIKVRRGNNFDCEVKGGRKITIHVTQKDDQGSLNFKLTSRR